MSTLLSALLATSLSCVDCGVDITTNGCPLVDRSSVQPPAFVLTPRGLANTVFADDYWDVCLPLPPGTGDYGGRLLEFFFYTAVQSEKIQNGQLLRVNYAQLGGLPVVPGKMGFARFTMRPIPPGRYVLEYARASRVVDPQGPYILQGQIEVNVVTAVNPIAVPVNQPWTLGLLGMMVLLAATSGLRSRND